MGAASQMHWMELDKAVGETEYSPTGPSLSGAFTSRGAVPQHRGLLVAGPCTGLDSPWHFYTLQCPDGEWSLETGGAGQALRSAHTEHTDPLRPDVASHTSQTLSPTMVRGCHQTLLGILMLFLESSGIVSHMHEILVG